MPKKKVVHDIEEGASLVPEIVAESVIEEVERFLDTGIPHREMTVQGLSMQARATYKANAAWRTKINDRWGRERLYAFMRHWLASDLKKTAPAIYAKLPSSFSRGVAISKENVR